MAVQVTTLLSGRSERYGTAEARRVRPLVAGWLGPLQFRAVLADGDLGPVWGPDDIRVLSNDAAGPRLHLVELRFPEGDEITLAGVPQEITALPCDLQPPAIDSSRLYLAFLKDGEGRVFGLVPGGRFEAISTPGQRRQDRRTASRDPWST